MLRQLCPQLGASLPSGQLWSGAVASVTQVRKIPQEQVMMQRDTTHTGNITFLQTC